MRAVIQRVARAQVEIHGSVQSAIGKGMLILIGVEATDEEQDIQWLSRKLSTLRIFGDDEGKMNLSIQDIAGEFLVVSQFTLHASLKKGNRPSFINAARPEIARQVYEQFLTSLASISGLRVSAGIFAADMQITLMNDGPVTIIIDTKHIE